MKNRNFDQKKPIFLLLQSVQPICFNQIRISLNISQLEPISRTRFFAFVSIVYYRKLWPPQDGIFSKNCQKWAFFFEAEIESGTEFFYYLWTHRAGVIEPGEHDLWAEN